MHLHSAQDPMSTYSKCSIDHVILFFYHASIPVRTDKRDQNLIKNIYNLQNKCIIVFVMLIMHPKYYCNNYMNTSTTFSRFKST